MFKVTYRSNGPGAYLLFLYIRYLFFNVCMHNVTIINKLLLITICNPIANDNDNYRLFVIYHLKTLNALDGSAIVSPYL